MASCSTQKEQGTPLKVYAETEGCFKKSRLLRQCLVLIGSMPVFIAGRDNIVWGGERSRVLPRCVAYPPPPSQPLGGTSAPRTVVLMWIVLLSKLWTCLDHPIQTCLVLYRMPIHTYPYITPHPPTRRGAHHLPGCLSDFANLHPPEGKQHAGPRPVICQRRLKHPGL
jgi:hypothetical protein